ncbi:MAG: glycoside hydrolase family 3 C-terminal domain-containing protein [Elusimicrobia bacterium]|nr:glycoside hydrolase family 3 C-terminal domain-containing protein [Elusimicrobiota bacterium]
MIRYILISVRPLILDKANALVTAWLPGTEGQGIAEVLFGDYNFKGKLSHSWPKSANQLLLNYGDSS